MTSNCFHHFITTTAKLPSHRPASRELSPSVDKGHFIHQILLELLHLHIPDLIFKIIYPFLWGSWKTYSKICSLFRTGTISQAYRNSHCKCLVSPVQTFTVQSLPRSQNHFLHIPNVRRMFYSAFSKNCYTVKHPPMGMLP